MIQKCVSDTRHCREMHCCDTVDHSNRQHNMLVLANQGKKVFHCETRCMCMRVGSRLTWKSAASVFVMCQLEHVGTHRCDCWSVRSPLRNGHAQRQLHYCHLSLHLGFCQVWESGCGPCHYALECP